MILTLTLLNALLSSQGSCHVVLLACVRPQPEDYDECFNTLQFVVHCQATRAKAAPQLVMPARRGADQLTQQLTEQVGERGWGRRWGRVDGKEGGKAGAMWVGQRRGSQERRNSD